MEDPKRTPGSVLLLCVCSGSVLLGDLVRVSRSMERDQSVLSIFPRIFLREFIVYRLLLRILFTLLYAVFYYMSICVGCFGLVVSTQVIG